jgi:hypothetical protein
MPRKLPFDDRFRAEHYLEKATEIGDCLCIGSGNYRPTWKTEERKSERIATLICRVFYGPSRSNVLHSCNNIACINPAHLRWGSQSENIKQAVNSGRMIVPDSTDRMRKQVLDGKHPFTKLTPDQITLIRTRLSNGEKLDAIAADFDVSFQQIGKIKLGQRWSYV